MDNASVHNKRAPGTPKRNTLKDDMIDWLIEKNVDFPPNALKNDLWEIIKQQLLNEPCYDIDQLVKKVRPDITIQRLPPYHVRINFYAFLMIGFPTRHSYCNCT